MLYLEIDVCDVAVLGQFHYLVDVVRFQHQAGESLQGSAPDTGTSQVLDGIAFYLDEGRSRTHADRYQAVESALVLGSQGIGDKFVRLGRRPSV